MREANKAFTSEPFQGPVLAICSSRCPVESPYKNRFYSSQRANHDSIKPSTLLQELCAGQAGVSTHQWVYTPHQADYINSH